MRVVRAAVASGVLLLAFAGQAQAATTVGQTFTPEATCGAGAMWLQIAAPASETQYAVPQAGVITSWSHIAGGSTARIKLKVGRPVGGANFTIVGESDLTALAPNVMNTFPTRIPVQAGDVIGLYAADNVPCGRNRGGYSYVVTGGDHPPGTTTPFSLHTGFQFDISAQVEPDADSDGFGDETQDACSSDATKQLECDPPETTITKEPKNKSSKSSAKYKFISDEAGSTFECKIDKKPFKPCASPKKFKVKEGKHKFLVRAIDSAGNIDPTADKDKFKVVD